MLLKPFTALLTTWLLGAAVAVAEVPNTESSASSLLPPATIEPPITEAAPTVEMLLSTMAQHRKNLNYAGTFTYQNNAGVEGFKLTHWLQEGIEYQRLYALNGPPRETRVHKSVECSALGEQVLIGRLDGLHKNLASLNQYYSFTVRGFERVAGRVATVLQVVPKDPFRFGYFLSVDRETGLLLKSLLVDEKQRVVEQFQFLELTTDVDVAALAAEPALGLLHIVSGDEIAGCVQPAIENEDTPTNEWNVAWLPKGFTYSGRRKIQNNVDMLMYTDGLSTFSIFLDPIVGKLVIEGRAQRGATNFYMAGLKRNERTYQLTIVGEVPNAVLEKLAQSVLAAPANP